MTQETETKEIQSPIPDHILTMYADLWAQRPHCAVSLETMLSKHFNVPIQIVQFSRLKEMKLRWTPGLWMCKTECVYA